MSSRKHTEFFEVFATGKQTPPPRAVEVRRVSRPAGSMAPATYVFTRGRLIALAAAAGFMVVAAFLLGRAVGAGRAPVVGAPDSDTARAEVPGPGPSVPRGASAGAPVAEGASSPPVPAGGVSSPARSQRAYRLQIIGGIRLDAAKKLRDFLQEKGYRDVAFDEQEGRYVVFVGRFDAIDTPEAEAFKAAFQQMDYEGKKQFAGAFFVRER